MPRYIDADKFEVVSGQVPDDDDPKSYMDGMDFVLDKIDSTPTADVNDVLRNILPIKVDQEIWTSEPFTDKIPRKGYITVIEIDSDGVCGFWCCFEGISLAAEFGMDEFGKTVFYTKEQAIKNSNKTLFPLLKNLSLLRPNTKIYYNFPEVLIVTDTLEKEVMDEIARIVIEYEDTNNVEVSYYYCAIDNLNSVPPAGMTEWDGVE